MYNKNIETFAKEVTSIENRSSLILMLGKQDIMLSLTRNKEVKAIINIKKNLIKARMLEILENSNYKNEGIL